jgi:hypothetical protein
MAQAHQRSDAAIATGERLKPDRKINPETRTTTPTALDHRIA